MIDNFVNRKVGNDRVENCVFINGTVDILKVYKALNTMKWHKLKSFYVGGPKLLCLDRGRDRRKRSMVSQIDLSEAFCEICRLVFGRRVKW